MQCRIEAMHHGTLRPRLRIYVLKIFFFKVSSSSVILFCTRRVADQKKICLWLIRL